MGTWTETAGSTDPAVYTAFCYHDATDAEVYVQVRAETANEATSAAVGDQVVADIVALLDGSADFRDATGNRQYNPSYATYT